MDFKVLENKGFIVEFTPEESTIAVAFLKTLSAPTLQQEMLLQELMIMLGGKPDGVDYALMLQ